MQALLPTALFYIPPWLCLRSRNSKENAKGRPNLSCSTCVNKSCTSLVHQRADWVDQYRSLFFCASCGKVMSEIGHCAMHFLIWQIEIRFFSQFIWGLFRFGSHVQRKLFGMKSILCSGLILPLGFSSLPDPANCTLSFSGWHSQAAHFSPPHWNRVFLK